MGSFMQDRHRIWVSIHGPAPPTLVGVVVVGGPYFYHWDDQKGGICCDKCKYTKTIQNHPEPVKPYTYVKDTVIICISCHDAVHRKLIIIYIYCINKYIYIY